MHIIYSFQVNLKFFLVYNLSFVNKTMNILFYKTGRHNNQFIGRSIYNQSIFTESKENIIGKSKDIFIKRSTNFALEGSPI